MNVQPIYVTLLLPVPTVLVHLLAHAMLVSLATVSTVLMIMNAMTAAITAMLMLLAPMFQDHLNVLVTMGTLVLESIALITTNVLPII